MSIYYVFLKLKVRSSNRGFLWQLGNGLPMNMPLMFRGGVLSARWQPDSRASFFVFCRSRHRQTFFCETGIGHDNLP
jgi:hypothetical protein